MYGNRVLQALAVLALLYYNLAAVHLKTARVEVVGRGGFPLLVLVLLVVEVATSLGPALRTVAVPGQGGRGWGAVRGGCRASSSPTASPSSWPSLQAYTWAWV